MLRRDRAGWWIRARVFVPDRPDVGALLGPFASASEARAAAPAVERGALHLLPDDGRDLHTSTAEGAEAHERWRENVS